MAGIPPKADAKFSLLSEVGFQLAATSTPNMHAFFRAVIDLDALGHQP